MFIFGSMSFLGMSKVYMIDPVAVMEMAEIKMMGLRCLLLAVLVVSIVLPVWYYKLGKARHKILETPLAIIVGGLLLAVGVMGALAYSPANYHVVNSTEYHFNGLSGHEKVVFKEKFAEYMEDGVLTYFECQALIVFASDIEDLIRENIETKVDKINEDHKKKIIEAMLAASRE